MAAVRIESQASGDIRFDVLAKLAGLADADHALGKMTRLWRACTDQQVHILSDALVAVVLSPDALVASGLGERVDGGIRIRGTKGRIEWLGAKRKASRKGGVANRARWKAKGEPNGYPSGFRGESPTAPAPAPAPAPATAKTKRKKLPPSAGEFDFAEGSVVGAEPAAKPSDHHAFIAAFDALFAEHNAGAKPTWPGPRHPQLKALLKANGLPECLRRSANMFRAPPDWPPKPHDFDTLVKHFDKFAQPFKRTGGHFKVTGDEVYGDGEVVDF